MATPSCSGHQITATLTREEDVGEVASATGDPHVSTIIGDSFNLWRIGWSTFVQIPLASVKPSWWLVRGDIQPYGSAPCVPAFSQQVRINENWLGINGFSVYCGSLESHSVLYATVANMFLQRDSVTEFVSEIGVPVNGRIATDNGWDPTPS